MQRQELLEKMKTGETFDLLVIGGGATGCGAALDAASRGLRVALVEKGDFASGTSSRSTKLVHGGVRYLEAAVLHLDGVQFNLVRDALHERGILLRIAPHLCHPLPLVTPIYRLAEVPYLLSGLKLYDLLAGAAGLGASRLLGHDEAVRSFPMIRKEGLRAGVLYFDGQFDDARMNVALALTALAEGAAVANYVEVVGLYREQGRVAGATVRDRIGGGTWDIRARVVVNATGPFADQVRALDDPAAEPILSVSSGAHIVLNRRFAPPEAGIMIPRTDDGRLLFVLPWHGRCLVGTTDAPAQVTDHPAVGPEEIEYLLRHLRRYFSLEVEPTDIAASWAGLRPLVGDPDRSDTAKLARDHAINIASSGLITISGGKWTTYRKMAQDTVDRAIQEGGLAAAPCRTETLPLHGAAEFVPGEEPSLAQRYGLAAEVATHLQQSYGDRAVQVVEICAGNLGDRLVSDYPYLKGEIVYAARHELAVRAVDFLARRIPLALLDRKAAQAAAPVVLELMAGELGWDLARQEEEREEVQARLVGML
ncbi:glycerol-3-phosphate dehydrogenase/oxidase [Geomesophilobacter sediminis]|uniref:Glycerol-3-phosphate dehydrogenase n=1 Tax=Geomesophilobacter sediminis TaxID=2798584 RepID=A0A8J7M380_9BACT|nr:FAD-dependent oxidoreductase [Geomesophilobacter sediminis]MBJ6727924.1 FAD-dependent oxidoreductase [Geomesophilobacter sediminis]